MPRYFPPGNPRAAPADYSALTSSVPPHIRESWDWKRRCEWRPYLLKQRMPRGMSFVKAVQQRLESVDLYPALSTSALDLDAARRPCEVAYTEKLSALDEASILECGPVSDGFLNFNQGFFKKTGVPSNADRELDVWFPSEKKWEHQMRHRTGYFIPFQQREAFCFNQEGLRQTCVPVPRWFGPFEVHYGFHAEMPPILSYMGSTLAADDHSPWWQMFNTEWTAMVVYELMYQACRGRLHFITQTLRESIRTIGCRAIMHRDDALAAQLQALVREVELIRWSLVLPETVRYPVTRGRYSCRLPATGLPSIPRSGRRKRTTKCTSKKAMTSAPCMGLTTQKVS